MAVMGGWGGSAESFLEEVTFKQNIICQIYPGERARCVGGNEQSQAGGENRSGLGWRQGLQVLWAKGS